MTEREFGTYLSVAQLDYYSNDGHWRMGQAYFNALADLHPDIADKLRGNPVCDPFYDDELLPKFLEILHERYVR